MWSFEINDICLRLCDSGETRYEDAGVAYLTDRTTLFGQEALAQLFVHPVQCQSTYWQRLNEDAVEPRTKQRTKNSDLVYNQLAAAFRNERSLKQDPGWVVVPSDLDANQVGLLYGILQFEKVQPRGFLDVALLAGSTGTVADSAYFIDLQLHRTVVTQLYQHDGKLEFVNVKTLPSAGYLQFVQRWIDTVAKRSLEESRFDPRVSGATEQQLFDRLRDQINRGNELAISVEHNGETRSTSVLQSELASSGIDVYDRILAEVNPGTHLLLGDHAAELPGFVEFIAGSGRTVEITPSSNHIRAIDQFDAQIPADADVDLHKSMKSLTFDGVRTSESTFNSQQQTKRNQHRTPTHALIGDAAYGITNSREITLDGQRSCYMYRENGAVILRSDSSQQLFVNGRRVHNHTTLTSGDRVGVGDSTHVAEEIVLIHVVDDG